MRRKKALSPRLSGTYCAVGCKKYIYKKNAAWGTGADFQWEYQNMQRLCLCKHFLPVRGKLHQIWPSRFLKLHGVPLHKKILLNEHRIKSAQKYLPKGMVNTKHVTVNLGCKHGHDSVMCKACIGTTFEGSDCLQVHIIRAKCCKSEESVLLENYNHVETYVINIDAKNV